MIIYKQNQGRVQEKLDKLIRRAGKLGKAALSYKVLPAAPVTIHTYDATWCCAPCFDDSHKTTYQMVEVVLTGEAPVIEGWKLLARVEHLQGENNLIHLVPGVEFDARAYHTRRICDHCNKAVRRNDTILITDGSAVKQVGRNCLADYCRSPEFAEHCIELGAFLARVRDLAEEEEREGFRYCQPEYKTVDVVAVAIAVVRDYGYQKKDSFNEPTVNRVTHHFLADKGDPGKVETTEADKVQAVAALAWLSAQVPASDYIRNLKLLCEQETLLSKHFGLVVSMPAAYNKALELIAAVGKPTSSHVGNIKDKITSAVRIEKIIGYESAYGFGDIVKMRDIKTGDLFVWFTSSLPRCEQQVKGQIIPPVQEGDIVDMKGTVKGHDDFRGEKQTMVTRCKLSPKSDAAVLATLRNLLTA